MKAVISTTYNDKYLYYLPIVTYCWNKLGVDVICFMPISTDENNLSKLQLVKDTMRYIGFKSWRIEYFSAPEHKQSTYAQCLRNYASCLDLPEDTLLVSSDVDMGLFKIPEYIDNNKFSVFGYDLVPQGQYPQCYVTAPVKAWREAFNLSGKTYQQAIDELLGEDECQDYRGCRWSVDQEQSFLHIKDTNPNLIPRAKEGTQFSTRRYDRDDYYILDRLSPDTIDFHMNRPGYEDKNFEIILTILKYHYPDEDFQWLIDFTNAYKQLL